MLLRPKFRHSWKFFQHSGNRIRGSAITRLVIPTTCLLYLVQQQKNKYKLLNETLKPSPNGDTYEMGLYLSSQKELEQAIEESRQRKLKKSHNAITFHLKRVWFLIKDHMVEPIYTVLRFLEISAIFLPVLMLYPISYFGRHHAMKNLDSPPETTGALLWYKILRKALEWGGPSFIKLGQWAGSRTDMFSRGLCQELGELHSNGKAHSLQYTKNKICESLRDEFQFDEIFEEFKEKPLGVGAIAQVYAGKLSESFLKRKDSNMQFGNDDTRWCAVKVIHPHASRKVNRDLKIMRFFASVIDTIPTMEWLSLPSEVENFSILMRLQLDLRIEVLNLKRFNDNFKDSIQVKFPKGFQDFTSRDVLFEEYVHGFPMEQFLKVKQKLNDVELCQSVSNPFIDSFLQMLILDDFVHADLHPGNVMIRFVKTNKYGTRITSSESDTFKIVDQLKEKYKSGDPDFPEELKKYLRDYVPQICFIDAGLITELNKNNRINFIALFNALARFDGYHAGELMIERSKTPETAINKEIFAFKVEKLVNKVKKRTFTLGTVSIGDLLDQMLSMVRSHHVRMEGDFVSVVVAILLLEGIGRQLDPDLDLFASSLPILREFGLQREAGSLLANASTLSMLKIWIGLELRSLMSSSAKGIFDLIKTDQLCPNY